jgi:tRNA 5-carboxymethoxyuridine methyltransferase
MRSDTCFDGIASTFEEEIYGSSRGHIRLQVPWADLVADLPEVARGGLSCLDAGGGAGQMTLRLAQSNNRVLLVDPSREMLDRADLTLRQAGVAALVSLVRAPIQELRRQVKEQFDLVLCHAVLEWLGEPKSALRDLIPFLKPGGRLSLMFYNRYAALQRRVFRGEYVEACRELAEGCGPRGWRNGCVPLAEQVVREWLAEFGLTVRSKAGIRMFHDYLPEALRVSDRLEELLEVEKAFRRQEPFASLGHHLHLICERAG